MDLELTRLLANQEPFICSYAEGDDPGAGGDPAPEPEPGPDPAPEPEPPAEPAAPEPPPPPAWATALQKSVDERFEKLEERLAPPEPEPEPDPVSDEELDKPLTKRELNRLIAEANKGTANQRAEERILEHCKTVLKAEYPDIVVKDPVTGVESLNPKYSDAVKAFYTQGDSGHVFEAALRRIKPPKGGAAPAPEPEVDEAILSAPSPSDDPKAPSYKDAGSLRDAGRMANKGG